MQQQAAAEILRAIAEAGGDVARPMQQIAETMARLFASTSVSVQLVEGQEFTQEYRVGSIARRVGSAYPRSNIRVGGRNLPGTVVAENRQIHIPDLDHLDPSMADFPGLPHARAGGARTVCGTPLRREGGAIGALIIFRDQLLPFTDDELALLQSAADQAVIAIENARLFNEKMKFGIVALWRCFARRVKSLFFRRRHVDRVRPCFRGLGLLCMGLFSMIRGRHADACE